MEKVIQLQDLQPGSSYLVRARAVNKYGVVSEWSQSFTVRISSDDTPPSIPASPTVQLAGPQKIVVSHDNTKDGGGDLEYDVVSYKVFQNTTNDNATGTLIHTMSATRPGSGLDSFATINVDVQITDPPTTTYYYVTAVDAAGNESQPSPTATGVDITFFESAYISDLTADKIRTGTLQANQQIGVGTVSPIILKSNETSPRGQIYIGGGNYANVDTAFYVDSTGKFSLKDALTWDGEVLTIDGYFQIGDEETTISGNQIRTGNLVSNNYLRIDPATDTGGLDGIPNNGDPNTQPTGTGDELYTYSGTWFDLDDGSIWAKNFYIDTSGNARFRGNLFASKARFSGEQEDPLDLENEDGVRIPTVSIESTDSDDGYLVFFKDVGRDAGLEFYTKQNDGSNWRRGSLAHLSDPGGSAAGGFLRLGAFRSKTDNTPGRIRIFAEQSLSGEQSEIYLDANRTYIQKIFLTAPTTTGDWLSDPITNFWKDPDTVSDTQTYFKVGSDTDSAVIVKKDSNGLDKVIIKDYEIVGVAKIIDDSRISVRNVSDSIDVIKIGKNVSGTRDGIYINSDNYWTLNNDGSNVNFRIGDTSSNYVNWNGSTLTVSGNITVTGGNAATQSYADSAASAAASAISVVQKFNGEVTGVTLDSLGAIRSAGKSYGSGTGWILEYNSGTPRFEVGNPSGKYMRWDGSALTVNGKLVGGTEIGDDTGLVIDDSTTYKGINVNDVLIITGYSGPGSYNSYGWISFKDSSGNEKGSVFDAKLNKNTVTYDSGRGVGLGSSGSYPFVEVGWETPTGTSNPRIVLKAANNTYSDPYLGNLSGPGIVINGNNFSIVGGASSFLYAPETTSPVKFLAKNSNGYLRWTDPPSGSGGEGSVTSVGLSAPTGFTVSGSPVTSSGTLSLSFGTTTANRVLRTGTGGNVDWAQINGSHISSSSVLDVASVTASSGFFNDFGTTVESLYGIIVSASNIPASASTYPNNTIVVVT